MEDIERLYLTPENIELGEQILEEMLGGDFRLIYGVYPHNKGLKGDEGVMGETVEIECMSRPGYEVLAENPEIFASTSTKLSNEIPAITKVLFTLATTDNF